MTKMIQPHRNFDIALIVNPFPGLAILLFILSTLPLTQAWRPTKDIYDIIFHFFRKYVYENMNV
jgi:hypothetical protein